MTILVWLAIGAVIGLAAAFIHRPTGAWALTFNLAAAIAGALGGGFAEGHGSVDADPFDVNALIVSACGALILVGILNLFLRRGDSHQ